MVVIDKSAVETARKNMETALEEYKNATTDRKTAMHRFIEANRAYMTVLRTAYNI